MRWLILAVLGTSLWAQTKIDPARLPSPTASTLGGVQSVDCTGSGHIVKIDTSGVPTCAADASGGIPSGMVAFLLSGSCPSGWTQQSLAGDYVLITVAANGDAGTSGGSTSYTPAGTVAAPAFTGDTTTVPAETVNSLTAAAQTITGSTATEASHTHSVTSNVTGTLTPAGTIAWPANPPTNGAIGIGTFVNVATATSGNCAATNIAAGTGSLTACKASAPNLTVPAESHSGSLTSPTISYPANVPSFTGSTNQSVNMTNNAVTSGAGSSHSHGVGTLANGTSAVTGTLNSTTITPLGHNSAPAFTGTGATIQPTFIKMIACSKN